MVASSALLAAQALEVTPSGVAFGNSGTRTETKQDPGAQGGRSGFYETSNPWPAANWYPGAGNWQHLIEARHSNLSNNFALQIAGGFFDQDLWFRKTNNSASQAWSKLVRQDHQGIVRMDTLTIVPNWPSFGLNAYWDGATPAWRYASSDSATLIQQNYNNDGFVVLTSPPGTVGAPLVNNLALVCLGNGNVGMGTWNPTHRLTVNGQVKSKGFVTDTSNWADYVFADDYALPSLGEVEAHIKEKRHLPGIPSAAEVKEAGGVELGEMQVKLLAKVEELTLHMIALEKQVRAQQARIAELEGTKL